MAFQMSFACRAKSRVALAMLSYTQGSSRAALHAPGFKSVIFTPNIPLPRFVSKIDCLALPGLRNQQIALYSGLINPGKAATFSTSSAASSTSFQPIGGNPSLSNKRTLLSRPGLWALLGAFGLSAIAASLHSSSLLAMTSGASTIDLDSPDTDWKEAKSQWYPLTFLLGEFGGGCRAVLHNEEQLYLAVRVKLIFRLKGHEMPAFKRG